MSLLWNLEAHTTSMFRDIQSGVVWTKMDRTKLPQTRTVRQPDVTVLVPTWRRIRELRQCLVALDSQEVKPLEVIVVGSRDDVDLAEAARSLMAEHPNTRILFSPTLGIVSQLNFGLGQVKTNLVFLTDDDGIPTKTWIAAGVELFGPRDVAVIGGPTPEIGRVGLVGRNHRFGQVFGFLTYNLLLNSQMEGRDKYLRHEGLRIGGIGGCNMAFDRRRVPGLDPRLRGKCYHFEDDMILSASRKKLRVVYSPEVLVYHDTRGRDKQSYRNNPSEDAFNVCLVLIKHIGLTRSTFYFLVYIMSDLLTSLRSRNTSKQAVWKLKANLNGMKEALATVLKTTTAPSKGRELA